MSGSSSSHLTGKIVGHVLKTAYPTSQPGSFSDEIAELISRLDAVPGYSDPPVRSSRQPRLADIVARDWDGTPR